MCLPVFELLRTSDNKRQVRTVVEGELQARSEKARSEKREARSEKREKRKEKREKRKEKREKRKEKGERRKEKREKRKEKREKGKEKGEKRKQEGGADYGHADGRPCPIVLPSGYSYLSSPFNEVQLDWGGRRV